MSAPEIHVLKHTYGNWYLGWFVGFPVFRVKRESCGFLNVWPAGIAGKYNVIAEEFSRIFKSWCLRVTLLINKSWITHSVMGEGTVKNEKN